MKKGEGMRVEILSGSQTGAVVDMPQPAAEASIATGFARAVVEPEPKAPKKAPK